MHILPCPALSILLISSSPFSPSLPPSLFLSNLSALFKRVKQAGGLRTDLDQPTVFSLKTSHLLQQT